MGRDGKEEGGPTDHRVKDGDREESTNMWSPLDNASQIFLFISISSPSLSFRCTLRGMPSRVQPWLSFSSHRAARIEC
ncbi:hypothetical protein EON64_15205 [archaeon]|nr:MAG: hypothetical protein EON64_15205 [archaeon]